MKMLNYILEILQLHIVTPPPSYECIGHRYCDKYINTLSCLSNDSYYFSSRQHYEIAIEYNELIIDKSFDTVYIKDFPYLSQVI